MRVNLLFSIDNITLKGIYKWDLDNLTMSPEKPGLPMIQTDHHDPFVVSHLQEISLPSIQARDNHVTPGNPLRGVEAVKPVWD